MTLAEVLQELERRQAVAARMNATAPVADVLGTVLDDLRPLAGEARPARSNEDAERHLDAQGVADWLGTSQRWVYDHADQLGVVRHSRKCIRFPESAVRRYLKRRR